MNQPENMTLKGTLDQRSKTKNKVSLSDSISRPGRWIVLLVLILSPWAFGSVYNWAQTLMAIALLVGVGFWWIESALSDRKSQIIPYVAIFVLAGMLLGLIQVLPLPTFLADLVLGRQQEIYQEYSGDSAAAGRVSVNLEQTWRQLQMLALALAGLMLGSQYFRTPRDFVTLLVVCAANGTLLAFFGIVQKLTYDGKIFWTFPVLAGAPFATFINRNNAAGFLIMGLACCVGLLPIVMSVRKTTGPVPIISKEMPFWRQFYYYALFFVSELTASKLSVIVATVLIAGGVVGCTSRGGGLAMLVGGVATLLVYGVARRPKNMVFVLAPLVAMVVALTGWIGLSDQLLSRFENTDLADVSKMDGRFQNWHDTWPAVSDMGWLGSGLGSYRQVHRLYSVKAETALFEYAENQFFQALVEAGWPGLILFLGAWLLAFRYASLLIFQGQSATTIGAGTLGVFLLASQAAASFFDFGLYIPANMLLMSVLVGTLGYQSHALAGRVKKKNLLRFEFPKVLSQGLALLLFAALTITAIDLYRYSRLDREMVMKVENFHFATLDLAATDRKIEVLESLTRQNPATSALNYLGELWIHRARLMRLEAVQQEEEFRNASLMRDKDENIKLSERLWSMTTLQRIQEQAYYLKREVSKFQVAGFLNSPFIRDNLPIATRYFAYSRRRAPLQPVVHLQLGQLISAMGCEPEIERQGAASIERAIVLAPSNPAYRLFAGIFYLQTGNSLLAAPHLHEYLKLQPSKFPDLMNLLTGRTDRAIDPLQPLVIFEKIIPDDAKMLYQFGRDWTKDNPQVKLLALEKAVDLLGNTMPVRNEEILLLADIQLAKGDTGLAIEAMMAALRGNPMDQVTQLRVAQLLLEQNKLPEALVEAQKLLRFKRTDSVYNELIAQIKTKLENLKQEAEDGTKE